MTIGIPKALIYWKRPYFWETFFENLGFKVLLSPQTNREIVDQGVEASDPETCFSNKVFFGHLLWLEGKAEWIFIPRLKANQQKLEYCPKFFGIPDLAKILVRTPVLTETFDERKEKFQNTLERLGKKLKKDKREVARAAEAGFYQEKKEKGKEEIEFFKKIKSPRKKIILVSHPYNLYDFYLNAGAKEKLEKLGTEVIFIDEVPFPKSPVSNPGWPKFHWEFGEEIMEKISEVLKYKLDGAVEISSFQCGSDAVLKEFVEREFKQNKIPFLYLIFDEQTGEAGVQTRLEAFLDTIH